MIYEYIARFYHEDGEYFEREETSVEIKESGYPESDQDEALCLADDKAEELMIDLDAAGYELELINVG